MKNTDANKLLSYKNQQTKCLWYANASISLAIPALISVFISDTSLKYCDDAWEFITYLTAILSCILWVLSTILFLGFSFYFRHIVNYASKEIVVTKEQELKAKMIFYNNISTIKKDIYIGMSALFAEACLLLTILVYLWDDKISDMAPFLLMDTIFWADIFIVRIVQHIYYNKKYKEVEKEYNKLINSIK